MKCRNSVNSLLANLVPPRIRSWPKFCFDIHVQIAIFLSIFDGSQQMRAQNLRYIVKNLKIVTYYGLKLTIVSNSRLTLHTFLRHPVGMFRQCFGNKHFHGFCRHL